MEELEVRIDVPKWTEEPEDARGTRFEALVRRFLRTQNYRVIERYRTSGSEIDLLCKNVLSDELLLAECKARKESVTSKDVSKLFSDLYSRDAALGYLFFISKLGKETLPRIDDLNNKSDKRIVGIEPGRLILGLQNAGVIKSASTPTTQLQLTREMHYLVLRDTEIWVRIVTDKFTGERIGLLAFSSATGASIEKADCPDLSDTDWQYKSLPWFNVVGSPKVPEKKLGLQTIARVAEADRWRDFLPANPADFVGRENTLNGLSDYLYDIANDATRIRILGVKGHSGWGKSSLCLKISERARAHTSSPSFILPVDCRAASDLNFPDLAFSRLLAECSSSSFIPPLFRFQHEALENPFETDSYRALFAELRSSKRSVGIIFDQFEEIIHREDKHDLFQRLQEVALLVDDMKQPLFVGFSWKTDGSVSSDNPGYQLWHTFGDRRKDFVIAGFSRDDADDFISRAAKVEGKRITPGSKETLIRQSSGYPWLLKKLTVRAFRNETIDQQFASADFSEDDIKALLDEDLENLSEKERSALRYVAEKSPVESYIVADQYGAETLKALIDRRIVVRSGNRLSVYWDIFREYIISGRIPLIPTTYIPTISSPKLIRSIRHMLGKERQSYDDFAMRLAVSLPTADNFIRDLSQLGITVPHRAESYFQVRVESEAQALKNVFRFLERHAIFNLFLEKAISKDLLTFESIEDEIKELYSFINPNDETLRSYFKRILSLAVFLGKARRKGRGYVPITDLSHAMRIDYDLGKPKEAEVFRAHAPVKKVLELGRALLRGPVAFSVLREMKLRNAVYAINTLGLSSFHGSDVKLDYGINTLDQLEELIANQLEGQDTIQIAREIVDHSPNIRGRLLGEAISDKLALEWSASSCSRYGSAIKSWVRWLDSRSPSSYSDHGKAESAG